LLSHIHNCNLVDRFYPDEFFYIIQYPDSFILLTGSEPNVDERGRNEKTEVMYGVENAMHRLTEVMSRVNSRADVCGDYLSPSFSMGVEPIKKGYIDFKKRGVKIRFITEITKDNIHYCKELMQFVDQLRHMDGVKGNMAVGETEYVATAVLQEAQPVTQTIYSNAKAILEQHRYFFDTLWSKAIPAEQKIREIEEGIIIPIRTRLFESHDEIIKEIKQLNDNADKLSVCSAIGGMQMSYNNFFDTYKKIIDRHRKKEGEDEKDNGLRWIISIDKDCLNLVKIFLESGIQIRHIKNMPPINFGVSDKEVALTIEKMEGGKMSQSFLISNEPLYVNHFNSLFEELWKNGIGAEYRIKDIEEGVDLADIEVVPSSSKAQNKYLNTIKSALEEIILIFPTTNAFIRQEKIGVIQLVKEAVEERNVKVRILVPSNRLVEQMVIQLIQRYPDHKVDVRYIEQMLQAKATILAVDRKISLVMELKDDTKTTFIEAIGLSTYSNSKAGALSYVAIFENLWMQAELYKQLMDAHEQLQIHDKMQKEFINVAAHELRTPIQPILGLTQILRQGIKDTYQLELLDVVIRNAKRLQKLTEDILDVTKIESKSLQLNKEKFNLTEMISNAIADSKNQLKKENNLKIELSSKEKDFFIEADKSRLYQVIMNLLSNAIKFTQKEGVIIITVEKEGQDNNTHTLLVSIKDTGTGIDPEIMPRLFSKFVTKSETGGTGLGLFISKSVIESHGGKIWAQNNPDGRGATVTFSLPLIK
jgi:two-component system, OmpR family, sensor histidine kinase VicK